MILGMGIDIIEIERFRKAILNRHFIERVFSTEEISYCESRGAQKTASFAVRFAAKEAVLKAFGTGLRGGALTEISILPDTLGAPQVQLTGYYAQLAEQKEVQKIHISLSHAKLYAVAQVLFEGEEKYESCECGKNA